MPAKANPPTDLIDTAKFRKNLLSWYAQNARAMPWRQTTDPYPIWLSEVMLQQTTVTTVIPYYHRFLAAFPTVRHLAAAPLQEVLHLWQGLGYYRRAHLLHQCAQTIVQQYQGHFPTTYEELLKLPGLGPYTAAAITALAYNQPASVLDGNVERVISRLYRIQQPLPAAKPTLRKLAQDLADPTNARLYANAIMELGATLCTPTAPKCLLCPVSTFCQALKHADQTTYPRKSPKKKLPQKSGHLLLLTNLEGTHLYLTQRPNTGLLSGLHQPPNWGWEENQKEPPAHLAPYLPRSLSSSHVVKHVFTHFKLTLQIHQAQAPNLPKEHLYPLQNLPPLPTLFHKALKHLKVSE